MSNTKMTTMQRRIVACWAVLAAITIALAAHEWTRDRSADYAGEYSATMCAGGAE